MAGAGAVEASSAAPVLVIPTENALPRRHGNPYARPNHDEVVAKRDDALPPPVLETLDLFITSVNIFSILAYLTSFADVYA